MAKDPLRCWKKTTTAEIDYYSLGKDFTSPIYKSTPLDIDDLNKEYKQIKKKQGTLTLLSSSLYSVTKKKKSVYLPAGIFKVVKSNYEYFLMHTLDRREELFIPLDISAAVLTEFNRFLESKDTYEDLHIMYRRGILLFGPPGTGKTTAINQILRNNMPQDTVVIFIDSHLPDNMIVKLRQDPRLKILVFEELTNFTSGYGDEMPGELLNLLDGEESLSNCFIIGTTNYPEKLPGNIVDRPGRFDKLYRLGYLSNHDIKLFLSKFLHKEIEDTDIEAFREVTVAQLKELSLLVRRDGLSIQEAYKQLAKHREMTKSAFKEFNHGIGFNSIL